MSENTQKLIDALNTVGNRSNQIAELRSTLNWSDKTLADEVSILRDSGANIIPLFELGYNGQPIGVKGIRIMNDEEQFMNLAIRWNGQSNIIDAIQKRLGWDDDKVRRVALKVEREGAPLVTLIDPDGGPPGKLVNVELIRVIDASTYFEPAQISMTV